MKVKTWLGCAILSVLVAVVVQACGDPSTPNAIPTPTSTLSSTSWDNAFWDASNWGQ